MRVLKSDGIMALGDGELALLREAGAELVDRPCRTEADLIAAGRDVDAIVTIEEPLTAAVIGELRRCRVIARLGIGVDTVDVEAAAAAGIWVTNVPDGSVDEASDHALALLLAVRRRIVALDASVRRGEWDTIGVAGPVHRLRGGTLGLVGFGRIARALAPKAAALGLELWAHDPYVDEQRIADAGVRPVAELDELLSGADIVSLHLPLTAETRGLLDRDRLRSMKPGAVLINVSRGTVVDEAALVQQLRDGRLAGAGLDVFAAEPPAGSPLLELGAVVLTSHSAYYSRESVAEVCRKAIEDVVRVLGGERPLRSVNEPRSGAGP